MPKVEQYEQRTVTEQAQATPFQRLDATGAFGSDIGKGIQNLGDDLNKIQVENDMATAKERTNILRDKIRDAMYHADDAYYRTGGRDAMTGRDGARDRIAEIRKEVSDGLSHRQLQMYDQIAEQYQQREYDGIESHAFNGRKSWLDQNDATAIKAAQEDLVVHYNDPAPYLKQIENANLNLANRNGWDKETREMETLKAYTVAHKSVIDRLVEDNPAEAQKYFDAAVESGQIMPSLQDDLKKMIGDQGDAQVAMGIADKIRTTGGNRSERLAAVNEIEDAGIRKKVKEQVISDFNQQETARKESELEAYDTALTAINEGDISATQYQLQNPKVWNAMSGVQQRNLLKGNATETDPMAYYEIKGIMAAGGKDAAMDYLLDNVSSFSSADFKQLANSLFKAPAEVQNIVTDKPAFDMTIEQVIGKKPTKGAALKGWQSRYNIGMGIFQDMKNEWLEENPGKKVIPERERREMLKQFQIKAQMPDSFMGIDLWYNKDITYQDIPGADLALIEQRLIDLGEPVTVTNILDLYIQGEMND